MGDIVSPITPLEDWDCAEVILADTHVVLWLALEPDQLSDERSEAH